MQVDVQMNHYRRLPEVLARIRVMFDVDCDLNTVKGHLSKDDVLAPLVQRYAGLRLPGCIDVLEFSIRAILGQQISVKAATTLAQRICRRYGNKLDEKLDYPAGIKRNFPSLARLLDADFANLGLTNTRMATLQRWLSFYQQNPSQFVNVTDSDDFERCVCQLKGIGPWTANYLAMRGLSLPDAFPAKDLGIIKALSNQQQCKERITTKEINLMAQSWRPWRAYAAIYLWQSLSDTH